MKRFYNRYVTVHGLDTGIHAGMKGLKPKMRIAVIILITLTITGST